MVAGLDAALTELYPPEQRFGPNLKAEHLEEGCGTFLVAREGDRAVGCGAIRLLDSTTAEAKRMYVEPDHRGRGIGQAVLAGLEAAARQLGVRRLVGRPPQAEPYVGPGVSQQPPAGQQPRPVRRAPELERRRALHQRPVQVEERRPAQGPRLGANRCDRELSVHETAPPRDRSAGRPS